MGENSGEINIKGLNYGEKLWRKHYNPNKSNLSSGLMYKLRREAFFEIDDPEQKLNIALDVLSKYSLSTAERYFAKLKYGGYINVPNISTLFLAKEHYGTTLRRGPQIRIPSIDQYHSLIRYLNEQLDASVDVKMSTNPVFYDRQLGLIIAILFVSNTALRLSEVLRISSGHLKKLLIGETPIEIKMKSSLQWDVVYHKMFYVLLTKMKKIFSLYLELSDMELNLFQFSREYVRVGIKTLFSIANNGDVPPHGFGLHTIRYYIGSQLAEKNLKAAQAILNHKSLRTSAVYVKYDNLKLQNALNNFEEVSPLIMEAKRLIN